MLFITLEQACRIVLLFFRLEVMKSLEVNWVGSNWEGQLSSVRSASHPISVGLQQMFLHEKINKKTLSLSAA